MKRFGALILLLFLTLTPSHGQWKQGGERAEDTADRKTRFTLTM